MSTLELALSHTQPELHVIDSDTDSDDEDSIPPTPPSTPRVVRVQETPNAPMRVQSRRWCGVYNNYPDNHASNIPGKLLAVTEGGIWGREVGEQGTKHIQAYFYTKKRYTLNGLRDALGFNEEVREFHMHLEMCKGNSYQNYVYCTKEGDFDTWGTIPRDGFPKDDSASKKRTRENWEETWELATKGKITEVTAEHRVKHYSTIKLIAADYKVPPQRLNEQAGVWIVGASGFGKSWSARTEYGGPVYTKDFSKWWHAYADEPVVVLDDISPEHAKQLGDNLKIWGDIYPFMGEIKGGHTGWIRPKSFIVTSQYNIHQVFTDQETIDAISRRFRVVRMEKCANPQHYDEDGVHDDTKHAGHVVDLTF